MLCERLAPAHRLSPRNIEDRLRMLGLCHELMSQEGLVWNARLLLVETSFGTQGARGFPVPIAQHLAARYGYRHPRIRAALESRREEMEALVAASLREHRDSMHRMHVPLPIAI